MSIFLKILEILIPQEWRSQNFVLCYALLGGSMIWIQWIVLYVVVTLPLCLYYRCLACFVYQ